MAFPEPLERLIRALEKFPGVGARSAERMALHVLRSPSRLPSETRETESARHIHVYEYDYTPRKRRGEERRPDGVVVHRVPA